METPELYGRRPAFAGARRLVVKIGSAVLRDGLDFDRVTFASLVRGIVRLRAKGLEVVVVSSGAVALGLSRMGRKERPTELPELQAMAAIGQSRLMRQWSGELGNYDVVAGQVLVTHEDLRSRSRFLAARHTLRALLELGAIPVINENDTVAVEEIKLGDNDKLSSQVVSLVGAQMLVILSDVDGLYDRDPREPGAARLSYVGHLDGTISSVAGSSVSGIGSGGMKTKLEAVRQVNQLGVPAVIAAGKTHQVLERLFDGDDLGTWFQGEPASLGSRKHWIAYALRPAGALVVDHGAATAVREQGRSLLSVGVTDVIGEFGVGESVSLKTQDGRELARGLAMHDSETIGLLKGKSSSELALLGFGAEVVHRDDLVLLPDD